MSVTLPDADAPLDDLKRFFGAQYPGPLIVGPCQRCGDPLRMDQDALAAAQPGVRVGCPDCGAETIEPDWRFERWARARVDDLHADRALAVAKRGETA